MKMQCCIVYSIGCSDKLTAVGLPPIPHDAPPFTRFDELTAGFDRLRTNGAVIEATGVFRSS
jgi:hypothetical protein